MTLAVLRGAHSASSASGEFDINALAEAPAEPKPLELRMALAPSHALVPRELGKDYAPEYALVGGLCFIIAGLPLLSQIGGTRRHQQLLQTVGNLLIPPPAEKDGVRQPDLPERDTQAVVCSVRLSHDVNEGYDVFVGERLRKLNGVKVRNMAHVVELLVPLLDSGSPPPRTHVVLQFYDVETSAVFTTGALRAATPRIQSQHKIPHWTSLTPPTATPV